METKSRFGRAATFLFVSLAGWALGVWTCFFLLLLFGQGTERDIHLGALACGVVGIVLGHIAMWHLHGSAEATAQSATNDQREDGQRVSGRPRWGRVIILAAIPVVVSASAALFWVGWVTERGSDVDPDRVEFEWNEAVSATFDAGEDAAIYARVGPNRFLDSIQISIFASDVTCDGEPDGLLVARSDSRSTVAIDRSNDWIPVARLIAEEPGRYAVSCEVTGYSKVGVSLLAVADEDPGNELLQRLSAALFVLGGLVLIIGAPTAIIVILFWGSGLWHGTDLRWSGPDRRSYEGTRRWP